jgi:hypothetical protein
VKFKNTAGAVITSHDVMRVEYGVSGGGCTRSPVSAAVSSGLVAETGFVINGQSAGDQSGYSVSAAGDVNGDGFADVIVGANLSDPTAGANAGKINGRDHNHHGYSIWMAGGGSKGGYVHGATDEFGFQAVENKVHVHDLQATIMHLLGFDHEKLTYRHAGRDFRLTDVHGRVIKELLA